MLTKTAELQSLPHAQKVISRFIGRSSAALQLLDRIWKAASEDYTVLLSGETGAGKELATRIIHDLWSIPMMSRRNSGIPPFVAIDCSAIPESLIESELFGHEKGAFTTAGQQKNGLLETAHGGTLFLDEIGDMPFSMQTRLLRFLQEREIRRVGGRQSKKVDVRVIAATNKDLYTLIQQKAFREDLFHRLNVVRINIPPLRERIGDIPWLVDCFCKEHNATHDVKVKLPINDDVIRMLETFPWPGNVRELSNVLTQALNECEDLQAEEKELSVANFAFLFERRSDVIDVEEIVERISTQVTWAELEKLYVLSVARTDTDLKLKLQVTGLSDRVFRYKLAKYGFRGIQNMRVKA